MSRSCTSTSKASSPPPSPPYARTAKSTSIRSSVRPKRLVSRGAVGAFVCGTTGEGQSLSSDERRRVLERWCAVGGAKLKIIAHVGHVSLPEARALAAHAAACGAVAIGAMPPYFFKSQNLDDILVCASQVASAAPQLPFYYYHFPSMSGISISASELLHRGIERIPNLAGLKFTDDNLMEFERLVSPWPAEKWTCSSAARE